MPLNLYWNQALIARHLKRKGATKINGNQLSVLAKLKIPTAYKVLSGEPMEKLDVTTWRALAVAFELRNPLTLLEVRDE